ncbi:hypothetical protein TIFTF001_015036 [Ficus carica]|uniref:Uncharacterized protein n=1 Tax=Ficus carica TaxID=3494 RepID=A0AA88D4R7_FICCA|nr:hypothetical protein TIFTF001_015036 [Ficus carica]
MICSTEGLPVDFEHPLNRRPRSDFPGIAKGPAKFYRSKVRNVKPDHNLPANSLSLHRRFLMPKLQGLETVQRLLSGSCDS